MEKKEFEEQVKEFKEKQDEMSGLVGEELTKEILWQGFQKIMRGEVGEQELEEDAKITSIYIEALRELGTVDKLEKLIEKLQDYIERHK